MLRRSSRKEFICFAGPWQPMQFSRISGITSRRKSTLPSVPANSDVAKRPAAMVTALRCFSTCSSSGQRNWRPGVVKGQPQFYMGERSKGRAVANPSPLSHYRKRRNFLSLGRSRFRAAEETALRRIEHLEQASLIRICGGGATRPLHRRRSTCARATAYLARAGSVVKV